MKWKAGQDFIDRLRFSVINKQKYKAFKKKIYSTLGYNLNPLDPLNISTIHRQYGKIYYPYYNLAVHHNGGGGFKCIQRIW